MRWLPLHTMQRGVGGVADVEVEAGLCVPLDCVLAAKVLEATLLFTTELVLTSVLALMKFVSLSRVPRPSPSTNRRSQGVLTTACGRPNLRSSVLSASLYITPQYANSAMAVLAFPVTRVFKYVNLTSSVKDCASMALLN